MSNREQQADQRLILRQADVRDLYPYGPDSQGSHDNRQSSKSCVQLFGVCTSGGRRGSLIYLEINKGKQGEC